MRWRALALALIVLGSFVAVWQLTLTPVEGTDGGAMALDCNATAPGIQDYCVYPSGATFSVQVHATKAPPGGYFAFQAKIRWSDDQLDYLPTMSAEDEALWSECDIVARIDLQFFDDQPAVVFGCVPLTFNYPGEVVPGPMAQLQFRCGNDGNSPLDLVPRPGDPHLGTNFADRDGYY
ncbi:MAG: hypothetical protein WBD55_10070, partial [Dehalococcoidia bacterium]